MGDERVGIRELRQNLSVYVRRVREGERFIVTDHNEPVAELAPVPASAFAGRWRELVERYGIVEGRGDLADLPPPRPYPPDWEGPTVLEDLLAERESDTR